MAVPLEKMHSPDDFGACDPYALVGEIVCGRFRVLALKSAGPRAVIYEVEPPGVGHMRRALKVITVAEAREPDVAERLRTVIRAMREADHPHLERVYDVGFLPDESPFVVTEWLPQGSLDKVLAAKRRLPAASALEILERVVRAAAGLHERGVVHGDIRPNHILLDMHGDEPDDVRSVKLIDAGVPGVLNMSPQGGATGQVAYLAPECLAGQARSPASDVYALGVLAYRLLTMVLPYRADDSRAATHDRDPVSRVRWLHLNASPVRPSRLVMPADFSPEIEAVIGRAMAKSLVERFPDAGSLLVALEQAMRAPLLRGPGAVAVPIGDDLPTEGMTPQSPPGPAFVTSEGPVLARTRKAVASGLSVSPAARPERLQAVISQIPETPLPFDISIIEAPRPRFWMYALAGVASGCLAGLL